MTRKPGGKNTRKAILQASRQLFLEQGYSATSMSRIASKARVTQSLIHHYFGSKRSLWRAVKQEMLEAYFKAQHMILETRETNLEVLKNSIIAYFHYFKQHPELVRLLTWSILEKNQEGSKQAKGKDLFQLGITRLRQSQEQGIIRSDVRAESILIGFMALVQNYFLTKGVLFHGQRSPLVDEADDSFDDVFLADILRYFIDGVKKR